MVDRETREILWLCVYAVYMCCLLSLKIHKNPSKIFVIKCKIGGFCWKYLIGISTSKKHILLARYECNKWLKFCIILQTRDANLFGLLPNEKLCFRVAVDDSDNRDVLAGQPFSLHCPNCPTHHGWFWGVRVRWKMWMKDTAKSKQTRP